MNSRKQIFSGHNQRCANMSSQCLWQQAQDLHKLKPQKIELQVCEVRNIAPLLCARLLALDDCWERQSQFSLTVWFLVCHSRVGLMPKNIGPRQTKLGGERGGGRERGETGSDEKRGRGGSGRIWRNTYDQHILMKFSKLIKIFFKCVTQNIP